MAIRKVKGHLLWPELDHFLQTLHEAVLTRKVMDLRLAFRCLTADNVEEYCFQMAIRALSEVYCMSSAFKAISQAVDMRIAAADLLYASRVLKVIVFGLGGCP